MKKNIPNELKAKYNQEKSRIFISSRIPEITDKYKKEKSRIEWKYESQTPVQSSALLLELLEMNNKYLREYGELKIDAIMYGVEKNKIIDDFLKSRLEKILTRETCNINMKHYRYLEMKSKKYNGDWTLLNMSSRINDKFSRTHNILLNKIQEAIYNYNEESDVINNSQVSPTKIKSKHNDYYINPERISEILKITSNEFNFQKLISLCEEINKCYSFELNYALLALQRTLIQHIPPIFNKTNFSVYWNSLKLSEKTLYKKLEDGLKNMADIALHKQIGKKRIETPTLDQIDFRQNIDKLLSDIIIELEQKNCIK